MTYARLCLAILALAFFIPNSALAEGKGQESMRAPHRARLALEGGLGFASGDTEGGALSLNVQLGYQGSDLWAIYYQTGFSLNGWAAADDSVDTFAFFPQLAMFDLTLGRMLQIGGGVGVDVGSFGVCVENECTMRESQTQPASEARLAVIIPLPGLRARWGIPLSLRLHSTYFSDSAMHTLTVNAGIMRF